MNRPTYRIGICTALAAVVVGLPACAAVQPGRAEPATDFTAEEKSSTSPPDESVGPPSEALGRSNSVAALDPCALLPTTTASQLQVRQGKLVNPNPEGKSCRWAGSGYTLKILTINFNPYNRVIPGWEMESANVAGSAREAVLRKAPGGECSITMEVGRTSSVDVAGKFAEGGNVEKACELARLGAQAVEPNLPKN